MLIEELEVYQISMALSDKIWYIVNEWKYFERDTVGKQLIRAADSISANISEGFVRYYYKENKQFCYYSRGSIFETRTWIVKAYKRNLISNEDHREIINQLYTLHFKLNAYIKSIGKNNQVTG